MKPFDGYDGAVWASAMRSIGPDVIERASKTIEKEHDLTRLPGSTLGLIGKLVAREVQRSVLLAELEACDWRLRQVGARLRMDGTGNIIRAIKDLGLTKEKNAAKARGLIKRGRPRTGTIS